ncbi:MAG: cation:dicarboxylase symporter family transporter [Bacteroidetes bacterium]|jgi:Na+/H+-dicarboxylate symporter|nr:cation:dicarboxylase symporter family transporter [Bacteroidota bacterium]
MIKIPLHWQILLGMALGILFGFMAIQMPGGKDFVIDWIKPFGTIFINALKLLAIPLIIASLIVGISRLNNITQLSKLGGRTIGIYLVTTVVAVTLGLLLVNTIKPGNFIQKDTQEDLLTSYSGDASLKMEQALEQKEKGPLSALEDLVPENIVHAATDNGNMLQVIFVVILFGIGMILIKDEDAAPVKSFFNGFNEIIMKLVDIVMLTAPYGVLALMATLVAESPSADIFIALGAYSITVVIGLAIMTLILYPLVVRVFTGYSPTEFLKKISPAQLLAFSTSSSAATLPVTMERVEEHLGVEEEVTSFVCPIGATINMDGTSLYQAIAAVFIAQVFAQDLSLSNQLTIVITATMASIGSAAVPGAGILMLIIVLESVGVNPAGIGLIFAVDRPLDMLRTVTNVTGDGAVAMLVGTSVGKLNPETKPREWDENYEAEND